MEKEIVVLSYMEGVFDTLMKTGTSEKDAFEMALLGSIEKYKKTVIYRTYAL